MIIRQIEIQPLHCKLVHCCYINTLTQQVYVLSTSRNTELPLCYCLDTCPKRQLVELHI